MIAYIIAEGPFDVRILQSVLPEDLLSEVEIVSAGGVSAAKSLARSLLVRRQVPVAMVVNADSVVPELVQERHQSIEEIVKSVASNIPLKVIFAIPEIEVIFFQDTALLSRVLGFTPSEDVLALADLQPRKVLEELLSHSKLVHHQTHIVDVLTHEDIKVLRKALVIQEIIQFLQSVHKIAKAS